MRRITTSLLVAAGVTSFAAAPASAQLAGMTTIEPEVVDPGAEPRQELRYRFVEGQAGTMGLDLTIEMVNLVDGVPVVDMEMLMSAIIDTVVTDVYDDGSARVELTFTQYDFADTGDELAQAELQALSDGIVGLKMWQLVDDRGNALDIGLDTEMDLPPEIESQVFETSMTVQPLPEDPVGVGARWNSEGIMDSQGVPLRMSVQTELLELDETGATMAMDITADAGDASVLMGPMPAGVELSVDAFTMDGGGEVAVAFDRLVPDSNAAIDVQMDMSVTAAEGAESMTFDVDFGMLMSMEMYPLE